MLPLEHADAEQLSGVLAPFLSPQGKIGAYSPTNTLIIRDQPAVVKMLIKVIKGREDLSQCFLLTLIAYYCLIGSKITLP